MTKIISWNINGLNSPNKCKIIYHWLKKQKEIICLQEMHLKNKDKKSLENHVLGDEFHSLVEKKVRGVVIYMKNVLCPKQVFSDPDG